jgi:myosin-5
VYTVADRAECWAATRGQDQSIIVSGESGAGKTEACKRMMTRLAFLSRRAAGDGGGGGASEDIERRVLECNPFLEAFGNAKTLRNDNSSRFGKFIRIRYDGNGSGAGTGKIAGVAMEHYLLETMRVTRQMAGERNFHVFAQMCAGASAGERGTWQLLPPAHFSYMRDGTPARC